MPKGRFIGNKIGLSRKVNDLPDDTTRLVFTWAITHLNILGCIQGDAHVLRSLVFPLREDLQNGQIEGCIRALGRKKLVIFYRVGGHRYLFFPGFIDEQPELRPNREGRPTIPKPPSDVFLKYVGVTPEEFLSKSSTTPERNRSKSGATPAQGEGEEEVKYKTKIPLGEGEGENERTSSSSPIDLKEAERIYSILHDAHLRIWELRVGELDCDIYSRLADELSVRDCSDEFILDVFRECRKRPGDKKSPSYLRKTLLGKLEERRAV